MNAKAILLAMRRDIRLLQLSGSLDNDLGENIRHELWLAYVKLCTSELQPIGEENDQ